MLLFETLSVVWTEAGGRTSELESLTFNPLEFPSDLTRFKRSSSSNCESIWAKISLVLSLQVNLCQKLFFLQNMGENMLCTKIVLNVRNNFCTQHVLPRFELGNFMYWTCNLMNNLLSYCGLVDAKIRASDRDLPVL